MRKLLTIIAIVAPLAVMTAPVAATAQPADPPAKTDDAGGSAPAPDGDATPDAAPADDAAPAPDAAPADDAPPAGSPDPAAAAADKPKADDKTGTPAVGATSDMGSYGVADGDVPPGGTLAWAGRRKIKVIQKRAILKQGRHGLSLLGGVVPNDDFFAYVTGGLGYNYYFSEDLALDIVGAYTLEAKTSLEGGLTAPRGAGAGPGLIVRLPETLVGYTAASVTWYLLHGKLAFFTTRLTEFDVGLNFGIGGNMTFIQGKSAADQVYRVKPNGSVGINMLFYLSERLALRVDYKQLFYPKDGGGVSFPIATTLGLAWFTAPLD